MLAFLLSVVTLIQLFIVLLVSANTPIFVRWSVIFGVLTYMLCIVIIGINISVSDRITYVIPMTITALIGWLLIHVYGYEILEYHKRFISLTFYRCLIVGVVCLCVLNYLYIFYMGLLK